MTANNFKGIKKPLNLIYTRKEAVRKWVLQTKPFSYRTTLIHGRDNPAWLHWHPVTQLSVLVETFQDWIIFVYYLSLLGNGVQRPKMKDNFSVVHNFENFILTPLLISLSINKNQTCFYSSTDLGQAVKPNLVGIKNVVTKSESD